MIRHPKVGQRVMLWYRDHDRMQHGRYAIVQAVGIGPGPKNVAVQLEKPVGGQMLTFAVSRGNLRALEEP